MISIRQKLVYFRYLHQGDACLLLLLQPWSYSHWVISVQYLLLCLLLYTYPLQLFVVIIKFSTFIFTHLLSHELGEEKEREREGEAEKRREVYREEGRRKGGVKGKRQRRKVGLEERREGGKGEKRESGRKKSRMLTTRSMKPKPTAHFLEETQNPLL